MKDMKFSQLDDHTSISHFSAHIQSRGELVMNIRHVCFSLPFFWCGVCAYIRVCVQVHAHTHTLKPEIIVFHHCSLPYFRDRVSHKVELAISTRLDGQQAPGSCVCLPSIESTGMCYHVWLLSSGPKVLNFVPHTCTASTLLTELSPHSSSP